MRGKWLLTTLLLGLAIGTGIDSTLAKQVTREAQITSLTNPVEWLKSGTAAWKAAKVNQRLEGGDKVRTGEGGQAVLILDDGSTIQLFSNTEFAIQSLSKDSATEQLESVLAILRGKLRAEVVPQKQGSKFEFETPVMVAAIRGTTPAITVGSDNSVTVLNEAGEVELYREGGINFTAALDTGDEVQVVHNPVAGEIQITSINGTFEVVGPDGKVYTLNTGDTLVLKEGAATFIPLATPPTAPNTTTIFEPTGATTSDSSASSSLNSPVSGD